MAREEALVRHLTLRSLFDRLERCPTWLIAWLAVALTVSVGIADYLTGHGVSVAILYLLPVGLAARFGSRTLGMAMALGAAVTWLVADQAAGGPASLGLVPVWNAIMRLALLATIVHLVAALREELAAEALRSVTDPVTGIHNRRGFYEAAERELQRLTRYGHPVSVTFIDVDGFKSVNDHFGHRAGDDLLGCIGKILREHVRDTDVAARVGGDEFAVLLGEADYPAAEKAVAILRQRLTAAMAQHGWSVTFSIGVATCEGTPPPSVDELLSAADRLMYEVKGATKNAVVHQRWAGRPAA